MKTKRPEMVPFPVGPFKADWRMFDRVEQSSALPNAAVGESRVSRRRPSNIAPLHDDEFSLNISVHYWQQRTVRDYFLAIASQLTEDHPSISIDPGIFGGMPHIENIRLSVGDVLSKLYIYGSIQAILEDYSPDINEDQIKEAIAYAQDFLEAACNTR